MRLLGYHDAYLGFLASQTVRSPAGTRVLDIGCGTGAFADAWTAIHGPDQSMTLLDPSHEMLSRARAALHRRGLEAEVTADRLEDHAPASPYQFLLAAHVIEHMGDPVAALTAMRALSGPGSRLWLIVSKPHWCNAIIWFQWRHRAYRPGEMRRFLASSGWEPEAEYSFPSGPPSRTSRGYLVRAV
jgi:ubiquinone/menaquinone biosynthesis C-methylase UbiE